MECHRYQSDTFRRVFDVISYKLILGLTATFERLDGLHVIAEQYCPVCDKVSIVEARINNWVSDFNVYKVIIEVDDIDEYKKLNKQFIKHFEFFNFDFNLAMGCVGPKGYKMRNTLRDNMCKSLRNGNDPNVRKEVLQSITYNAMQFMRTIQARKKFINAHPKKLELCREILEHREDKKCITFSNTIAFAEKIKKGFVYSSKETKKKNRITLEKFNELELGVINTAKALDEGADLKGLSVGVVLGLTSSKTQATQRLGRIIRREEGKTAELFVILIKDTVEIKWAENAFKGMDFETIDEDNLRKILKGQEFDIYKAPIKQQIFRF